MPSFLKVPSLDRLSHELSKLPGIGSKTAERLALSIIKKSVDDIELFREALIDVKTLIKECTNCYSYTEEDDNLCSFCSEGQRQDHPLICVVKVRQTLERLKALELLGTYMFYMGA